MSVSLTKVMTKDNVRQVWRARFSRPMPIELVESERECYIRLHYVKG